MLRPMDQNMKCPHQVEDKCPDGCSECSCGCYDGEGKCTQTNTPCNLQCSRD